MRSVTFDYTEVHHIKYSFKLGFSGSTPHPLFHWWWVVLNNKNKKFVRIGQFHLCKATLNNLRAENTRLYNYSVRNAYFALKLEDNDIGRSVYMIDKLYSDLSTISK